MNAVERTAELIPVRERDGRRAVSGRDLHEFLDIDTAYNVWFNRMLGYGFEEDRDFQSFLIESSGGRPAADHALSLDMAKELSMIQRTLRGKQARAYFIEMEKRAHALSVPALPDLSTPEGVLALAQTLTKTAEELVAAKNEVAALTPLASQARTFNKSKGNKGRQQFARDIVNWANSEGVRVTHDQVYDFLAHQLKLFVRGNRSDNGHARTEAIRAGYADTIGGNAEHNGHAFQQGVLLPKGVEYAWSRIEKYVREHGHLELPKKGLAA